jgi:GAF domain-containing protein
VLPLGHGASGRAAAARAAVILNDYQREVSEETPGRRSGICAAVGTPLLDEGRLLGALAVMSRDPATRFTAEDAQTLEILASVGAAALVALERARLDGVLLAARTAQHELNNRLTLTTGFAELLQRDPALPPHLREAAGQAYHGAKAAASILQQLQKLTHLEETDWGPSLHPTIDLAGSSS